MASYTYPSATSTYVPDHNATNKLVVEFARNASPGGWAMNQYCQILPVQAMTGFYLRMNLEEACRVSASGDEMRWPDGQPHPEYKGLESFKWESYRCERYSAGFILGDLTVDQSSWDIVAQHARITAQKMMTRRTRQILTAATTSGNHLASHRITATSTAFGNSGNALDQSTVANGDIKRTLAYARQMIVDDTLGAVNGDDLIVVMNDIMADRLLRTQEVVDYLKGSPFALDLLRNRLDGGSLKETWGCPDLWGFKVVVEKTRVVTNNRGGTKTVTPALATGTMLVCARPGDLVGVASAPNFSAFGLFEMDPMQTETLKDVNNKRTIGRVNDSTDAQVIAPEAACLITAAAT